METHTNDDWLTVLADTFDHPSVVLWRAVELRHISAILAGGVLKGRVLDLGCAEGRIAGILFHEKMLFGIDNTWELLRDNKAAGVYRGLALADACRMPYKDNAFDGVFSNCVIEHIPDLGTLLGEVGRVVRPGGAFLFTVPSHHFADFLSFSSIFSSLRLKKLADWYGAQRNKSLNHFHCYDHTRWEKILNDKGFEMAGYEYYMPRKTTFVWDFLAVVWRVMGVIPFARRFQPRLNKKLINHLRVYYTIDSETGSGLLIHARKKLPR